MKRGKVLSRALSTFFSSSSRRKEKVTHETRADEGKESVIADDGCECVKSSAQINEHEAQDEILIKPLIQFLRDLLSTTNEFFNFYKHFFHLPAVFASLEILTSSLCGVFSITNIRDDFFRV